MGIFSEPCFPSDIHLKSTDLLPKSNRRIGMYPDRLIKYHGKEAQSPEGEWLEPPFNLKEFECDQFKKYIQFQRIGDQFQCGNPDCRSMNTRCIWYEYKGIDLGVDHTKGEFYCQECGHYTFVDYFRDSS